MRSGFRRRSTRRRRSRADVRTGGLHAEGGWKELPLDEIPARRSQHRGRLFLPFVDDDPRTAEVVSKVLLLARDRDIRDPNILEWVRAAQGGTTA